MTSKFEFAKQFLSEIPHAIELGIYAVDATDNEVTMALEYDERFVGDPTTGVIHGGPVVTLLDTCCATTILSRDDIDPDLIATISLRMDYMRPATPGQRIKAVANCYNITKTIAFVRGIAYDEDESRPVALATGTFTSGAINGKA